MKVICLSDFKRETGEIKSCGCSLLFKEFEEPGLVAKRTFSLEDSASLTGRFVELHWNTLVQLTDFLNSEHPFRTIKRQLSYAKVRDRSLSKNTNLFYLFAALSNMRSDRFAVFKPFYASFTAVVLVLFRHVGAAAASNASLVFVTRAWPCSSWSIHWSSP